MANLLDQIRQNRQQQLSQQAPVTDQTNKVQQLLRAKSGRAGLSSDAAVSNVSEQAAVADTNAQLAALAPAANIQQQQEQIAAKGQEQQYQQQKQDIAQTNRFNTIENNLKTNQLLNDLSRDRGQLGLEKDQARLEQAAFLLSMQDKQYTSQLEQIGRQRRLDDQAAFNDAMADVAFKDNLALVKQKLGTNNILAVNDRDFAKAMSNMSLDEAMQVADIESQYATEASDMESGLMAYTADQQQKQANQQAKYKGYSDLVSAGAEGYGAYAGGKFDKPKTAPAQPGQSNFMGPVRPGYTGG